MDFTNFETALQESSCGECIKIKHIAINETKVSNWCAFCFLQINEMFHFLYQIKCLFAHISRTLASIMQIPESSLPIDFVCLPQVHAVA